MTGPLTVTGRAPSLGPRLGVAARRAAAWLTGVAGTPRAPTALLRTGAVDRYARHDMHAQRGPHRSALVRLTHGECHYRFDGPADGPVLFLLHGATVPAWQFDLVVPRLCRRGYRVLRIDLYGHGASARPEVAYDSELFVGQVGEALARLVPGRKLDALGYSFGGAVVARAAARDPERFRSVLLAAPMLTFRDRPLLFRLLRMPLLGELVAQHLARPALIRERCAEYETIGDGRWAGLFEDQATAPGFGRALVSMIRQGTLTDQAQAYRALSAAGLPTAIVYGERDPVVPKEHVVTIADLLSPDLVAAVPKAQHDLFLGFPRRMADHLLRFLAGNRPGAGPLPVGVAAGPRCRGSR